VLCTHRKKQGFNVPIEFEQNQIDKILTLVDFYPHQFRRNKEGNISVDFNARINSHRFKTPKEPVRSWIIEEPPIRITDLKKMTKKQRQKLNAPVFTEGKLHGADYTPNDAMNGRVGGNFWTK
jgi:hypothetical protein